MNQKNVQIPMDVFNLLIQFMEYWEIYKLDRATQDEYHYVYSVLHKKLDTLKLRESYANIIFAEDEDKRFDARMNYLQHKRIIKQIYE